MNDYKEAIQYANDVVDGKIIAGNLITLSCKRFINDLKDERFEFREDKVNHCFKFINKIKHYIGEHSGKNFILQPW